MTNNDTIQTELLGERRFSDLLEIEIALVSRCNSYAAISART